MVSCVEQEVYTEQENSGLSPPRHMEVPSLGGESELRLLPTPQPQVLNPLSRARY